MQLKIYKFFAGLGKIFLGRALSTLSGVLILTLISRLVGPVGLGIFATILTTAQFCSNICKFGLEQVALAEAPRAIKNHSLTVILIKSLAPIFGLGILLSFGLLLGFFAVPKMGAYFASFKLYIYIGIFVVFYSYQFILGEFFRAREFFLWASLSKGGISNLVALGFFLWIYFVRDSAPPDNETLWIYMLVSAAISATFLTTVFLSKPWVDNKAEEVSQRTRSLIRSAWYFLLSSQIIFLVSQSDIWISASRFGAAETGLYSAASRIILLTTFLASLFNGLFTPKLSKLAEAKNLKPFEEMLRAVSFLNATTGLAVFTFLIVFAEPVLAFTFGTKFEGSGSILRILLFGQLASILVGPVGYALITLHKGEMLVLAAMIGLLTAFALVGIFSIRGLSQLELAVSFAVGNITLQMMMFWALRHEGVSALPSIKSVRKIIHA